MKRLELFQKLKQQRAVFVRHGAKHDVYMQPGTGKEAAVPRHDEMNYPAAERAERRGIRFFYEKPVGR
jgi:hypothetical protein